MTSYREIIPGWCFSISYLPQWACNKGYHMDIGAYIPKAASYLYDYMEIDYEVRLRSKLYNNCLMLQCLSHRWIMQYIFTCNLFHLNLIYRILTIPQVTWRVIHVEHDQLTILKHSCSSPVFDEAWVAHLYLSVFVQIDYLSLFLFFNLFFSILLPSVFLSVRNMHRCGRNRIVVI